MTEPLEPRLEQLKPEAKELWWSHPESRERSAERKRRMLGINAVIKAQQEGRIWKPNNKGESNDQEN